jgi:hypothetical protein
VDCAATSDANAAINKNEKIQLPTNLTELHRMDDVKAIFASLAQARTRDRLVF